MAQRQLGKAANSLSSAFERLSSGARINKASDDAAGLSVSMNLDVSARVFTQAVRNINDGISALSISEGALQELSSITTRQRELAEQAANGVYSISQRKALDTEANALLDEFNRIVQTTEFNDVQLLAGNTPAVQIQAGFGTSGNIEFGLGDGLERTVGNGTFAAMTSYPAQASVYSATLADINGDGKLDILTSDFGGLTFSLYLGNGDGTFKVRVSTATGAAGATRSVIAADFNNDGKLDVASTNNSSPGNVRVYLGNGDGTFRAPNLGVATGNNTRNVSTDDLNRDGILDLVTTEITSNAVSVFIGNGDGSFRVATSYATGTNPYQSALADLNNDGFVDIVTPDSVGNSMSVLLGNGDGSFRAKSSYAGGNGPKEVAIKDINHDGILDLAVTDVGGVLSIYMGNGDGSFRDRVSYTAVGNSESISVMDFNGDGIFDVATGDVTSNVAVVLFGNANGTFKAPTQTTAGNTLNVTGGDVNGDGAVDLVSTNSADATIGILLANPTKVTTVARLDLLTQSTARESLNILTSTHDRIIKELGNIGSSQSRLEIASRAIQQSRENYVAASSRIKDADVAEETAALTRANVLQQVATAVLAQANQSPQLAVTLLRG